MATVTRSVGVWNRGTPEECSLEMDYNDTNNVLLTVRAIVGATSMRLHIEHIPTGRFVDQTFTQGTTEIALPQQTNRRLTQRINARGFWDDIDIRVAIP